MQIAKVIEKQNQNTFDEIVIPLQCEPVGTVICEQCNDLGTVMEFHVQGGPFPTPSQRGDKWLEIDGKSGWWHGKLIVEPCPSCQARQRIGFLQGRCGLTDDEFNTRLTEFKTTGVLKDKRQAYESIAMFAGKGNDLTGFATMHGSYGVGKSMLGKSLVAELVRNGAAARYVVASEMLNQIRSNFDEVSNPMLAVEFSLKKWKSAQILVIDEFDKLSMKTEWTQETIHRLINARYEGRKEKFTMLIMNTAPKELPEDYGYLTSRIFAGHIIHVPGIDVRPGAK